MKALKIISGIIFAVGLLLIIGAVGQDDFFTMELEQAHAMNWIQIIIGMLMALQFVVVKKVVR